MVLQGGQIQASDPKPQQPRHETSWSMRGRPLARTLQIPDPAAQAELSCVGYEGVYGPGSRV